MNLTKNQRQSFFEAIQDGDEELCRALWLGVILQAILDAKGRFGNIVTRSQARIWLEAREDSQSDFAAVCSLAGVDFEKTRKRCMELLNDRNSPIDFRAMKRDKDKNRTVNNRKRYFNRARKRESLRRIHEREQAERFLFGSAVNDNFPDFANDNFINSTKENNHE